MKFHPNHPRELYYCMSCFQKDPVTHIIYPNSCSVDVTTLANQFWGHIEDPRGPPEGPTRPTRGATRPKAQAQPSPAQAWLGTDFWKSGNLEIWDFGIQKIKILKIKIRVAQNVGKVEISRKNPPGLTWGHFKQIFPWAGKIQKYIKYEIFAHVLWWANGPHSPGLNPTLANLPI